MIVSFRHRDVAKGRGPAGLRMLPLKGPLKGRSSVSISGNWRFTFTFECKDAAKALCVSRKTPSSILNRRAGISPEMAVRLSIAFDSSAESWMRQQVLYDLRQAEKRRMSLHVVRIAA